MGQLMSNASGDGNRISIPIPKNALTKLGASNASVSDGSAAQNAGLEPPVISLAVPDGDHHIKREGNIYL